jgi:uridine nucleosidase
MKKVWIDTDPGVDDTVAIAMCFEAKDQVEVMGVSTIFGNVGVEVTTRNAKILLEALGKNRLTLARGAAYPLAVSLDTSPFVHGENGLGDMPLPPTSMAESPLTAPQAIIEIILAHPHEITLFPIGPLTNIAMAYLLEPKIANLVKEVVIMGGAVRCPGNITPAAEANFYHDPHAAQIVIHAGWDITLVSLDVCNTGLIPLSLLEKIYHADKPLTRFIAGSTPFYQDFLKNVLNIHGHVEYPDAVAAAYLLNPGIFSSEKLSLFVETEGSCQGQSLSVPGGKWYENPQDHAHFKADESITPVNVLLKLDVEGYLRLIEESLV